MAYRYLSDMVWFVWSNTALMISGSGIRFIVRLATMLLIRLLSLRVNLDVLLYSPFRKIKFLLNSGHDPAPLSSAPGNRSFLPVLES